MRTDPEDISTTDSELKPSFRSVAVKFATVIGGLFGVSGILYGIGFLVLRSHYSLLGVWGGIPFADAEIVEEGGRFSYHLLFAIVQPFVDIVHFLRGFHPAFFLALAFLVVGFERLVEEHKLTTRLLETFRGRRLEWLRQGTFITRTVLIAIALAGTIWLLETSWEVVAYDDALYSCNRTRQTENSAPSAGASISSSPTQSLGAVGDDNQPDIPEFCQCIRDSKCRGSTYVKVVWGTLVGLSISWILFQQFSQRLGWIPQILITMQWIVVAAGIGIVPVAYGKLMLPLSYPSLNFANTTSGETLLLASTSSNWIVWNVSEKRMEILPRNEQERIIFSRKKSILP
jgi:hypothetical protein